MKELSIEEKAKAYDEAYNVAENIHRFSSDIAEIKRMEEIFPELKENEDEKVRRLLREIVLQWKNGHQAWCSDDKEIDTILAWLEKQGEGIDYANKEYWRGYREGKQEILDKYAELEKQGKNNIGISKSTKQKLEDNLNKALEKETAKSWNEFLEKQGEQNSDKIVEKAKTEKQRVLLTETDGTANIDWDCRSLDDAKILLSCGLEFIRTIEANKQILTDSRFGGCSLRVPSRYDKDIKRGEQKPAWSEEDENIVCFLINVTENYRIRNGFSSVLEQGDKAIEWLKSLKDRVQPQPKQEWSEEEIENCAKEAEDNNCIILAKHIRQLKSLRPKKHKED